MNFLNLTPLGLAIGLAAIAGIAYALQQLRIRYSEVPIATTMFWAAVARDAPVRVFRQRFKHLLAYLLTLLICWLLWVGFAGPVVDDQRSAGYHILILDGSAHSLVDDEFQRSKNQILEDISKYAKESREVFLSGSQNVKILANGEDNLVLERRLANIEPAESPSMLDELLRLLVRNDSHPEHVNIVVYGRAPIASLTLESLPAGFNVTRNLEPTRDLENRGIVALGIGEALSGQWNKVDVLTRIVTTDGLDINASDLQVQIGGRVVEQSAIETLSDNEFRISDVVADGSKIQISINVEDDLPIDDVASMSLPLKTRVRVLLGDSVPSPILSAIRADAGIEIVRENPDVAVLGASDIVDGLLPALQTVRSTEQNQAFVIGFTGDGNAEEQLQRSVASIGLSQIDAVALATEMDREIGVELVRNESRFISMWEDLLSDEFNFTDHLSFPLFISRAIRYLADEPAWYAYLAAGKQPYLQSAGASLTSNDLLAEYSLGTYFVRSEAGSFEARTDEPVEVALLDESVSAIGYEVNPAGSLRESTGASSAWSLVTWLVLLAFVLIAAEWYLYQRGLMP